MRRGLAFRPAPDRPLVREVRQEGQLGAAGAELAALERRVDQLERLLPRVEVDAGGGGETAEEAERQLGVALAEHVEPVLADLRGEVEAPRAVQRPRQAVQLLGAADRVAGRGDGLVEVALPCRLAGRGLRVGQVEQERRVDVGRSAVVSAAARRSQRTADGAVPAVSARLAAERSTSTARADPDGSASARWAATSSAGAPWSSSRRAACACSAARASRSIDSITDVRTSGCTKAIGSDSREQRRLDEAGRSGARLVGGQPDHAGGVVERPALAQHRGGVGQLLRGLRQAPDPPGHRREHGVHRVDRSRPVVDDEEVRQQLLHQQRVAAGELVAGAPEGVVAVLDAEHVRHAGLTERLGLDEPGSGQVEQGAARPAGGPTSGGWPRRSPTRRSGMRTAR